ERTRAELSLQVTNDVATNVPSQMKDNEQAKRDDLPLWHALMYNFERHASHVGPFRVDIVRTHDHEDHHNDNALPEGESSAKR
ncbi:hypothetical protein Tco_0165195, partial [Tanacetum coccineum]